MRPWICKVAVAVSLVAAPAWPAPVAWPDTQVARLQALALIETLNADLLSHDSATATLQAWCDDHHLAPGARMAARRVKGADKPPPQAARQALGLMPGVAVRYRRVQLACGDHVLSEADNWYLPARLTADMNRRLDETDSPFGVVVKALDFHRRTLSAALLFRPLPPGWEMKAAARPKGGALTIPAQVLQHSAVLSTPDGAPFSFVVETYTDQVLAFGPP